MKPNLEAGARLTLDTGPKIGFTPNVVVEINTMQMLTTGV